MKIKKTFDNIFPAITTEVELTAALKRRPESALRLAAIEPGGALVTVLAAEAVRRDEGVDQMCLNLGVTCGYLNQLATGSRRLDKVGDDFASSCADYIDSTQQMVLLLAGRAKTSDFQEFEPFAPGVVKAIETLVSLRYQEALLTVATTRAAMKESGRTC